MANTGSKTNRKPLIGDDSTLTEEPSCGGGVPGTLTPRQWAAKLSPSQLRKGVMPQGRNRYGRGR